MRKPTLLTLFLVVFIDLVGFGIVIPLVPLLAREYNASGIIAGAIMASFSLMQFIFSPLWGRWSDRIGRRPIILLSLAGSVVAYLIFAEARGLGWILISRIFAGICGANISVANAYIADITTKENRSRGMGVIGAAFGLGFVLGPFIGGWLSVYGYHAPGYAAAGICAVSFVLAWFYLPESRHDSAQETSQTCFFYGWDKAFRHPVIAWLVVIGFLSNLAFAGWETTFGLFLQERFDYSAREVAYSIAYLGLIVAVMQGGLIGRCVKQWGEKKLLITSGLLFAGAYIALAYSFHLSALLGSLAVLGVANGISRPVLFGLVSQETASEEQGLILGVLQSVSSLARIVGPPLCGWMFDYSSSGPLWLATALMLFCVALSLKLVRRKISG